MISIDRTLCVSCGRCIESCPMGIFRRDGDGRAEVGKEKRCMRCMHCSAACPVRAVHFEGLTVEETYPAPTEDEVARLIEGRRSIRRYRAEPPKRALIEAALEHAAFAPSAKNRRASRWTVLYGKACTDRAAELALAYAEESKKAPELAFMARAGKNLITCGAPCVILCHAPGEMGVLDGAIAMATLELLLVRAGLGTCWGGYLSRITDEAPALRAWLGLPEGDRVCCALMVGYPDGDHYPNLPCRAAAETHWIEE